MALPERQGLYDPRNEHDSCGIGFVANIKGRKSHDIIARGLQILVNLDHRGAVGADPLVGDGAGCLIQMPDALLRDWASATGADACRRPAAMPSQCAFCRGTNGRARSRWSMSSISSVPRGRRWSAGATCRPTRRGSVRPGHRDDAVDQPGDRRLQPRDRRPGRLRAQDPDDPQAGAEQRHGAGRAPWDAGVARPLHAVLLDPHPRLQGPAAGAAGRELLRGFAQPADGLGAGARPSAVFDQHLPVVAARPPVPVSVPQRRDQHGPRQRQLDGGAPPGDDVGAAWVPISPRWCR